MTTTMATTMTLETAIARWAAARRDMTVMTMATGNEDIDVNGDRAADNEVGDDGDSMTGDANDVDDDGNVDDNGDGDSAMGSGTMDNDDDDDGDWRRGQ